MYPTRITGTEILVNPFEGMERRERIATRTVVVEERKVTRKKLGKAKGKKVLLSFGVENEGDDEDAAPAVPLAKKAKFNTKLVTAAPDSTKDKQPADAGPTGPTTATAKPTSKHSSEISPPAPASFVQEPASPPRSTRPPTTARSPAPSSSSSPSPELTKVTTLVDRTNAQIAELKASMRRTVAAPSAAPSRKKSALEQMIPETSIRGRKRKYAAGGAGGGGGGGNADREALDILKAFRAKLENAPEEKPDTGGDGVAASGTIVAEKDDSRMSEGNGHHAAHDDLEQNEEEEEDNDVCDLHFIQNCQSCRSWDSHSHSHAHPLPSNLAPNPTEDANDNDNDNDTSWMSHALSFAKDRFGKDLTWRRKNEEELVVIDPREKGREILGKGRAEKREAGKGWGTGAGKGGEDGRGEGGGREWDRRRDGGAR